MPEKSAVRKKAAPISKPFWIGFDLGGTKMMASVLDADYKVLGSARKSTQGAQGAAKGVKRITATICEAMEAANVKPGQIQGIGIG